MKHTLYINGLVIVLMFAFASPLFSAKKKDGGEPTVTPTTDAASQPSTRDSAPSSKAAKSQAAERKIVTPSNSNATTSKRTIRQPHFEFTPPQDPAFDTQRESAAGLKIDWISVNHGGAIEVASGNLKMGVSIAQAVAGEVSSANHTMGLGFWYGAGATAGNCQCPLQGDMDGDGFPTALDVGWIVDITFAGTPDFPNEGCPTSRCDFDNDGFVTALDVGWEVDYVFGGGPGPCDPCNPIQGPCAP